MNSIVFEKVLGLRRCVSRAREQLVLAGSALSQDLTHQDVAVYNVVRACAAVNDLSKHLARQHKLDRFITNEDAYRVLCRHQIIPESLCPSLAFLVDFRNVALRTTELDLDIVIDVIQNRLNDVLQFADIALALSD